MRCVNCQQEINAGAYQCPYCLHNPWYPAWADKGTKEDQVHTPGPGAVFFAITAVGVGLVAVSPFLGVPVALFGGTGLVLSLVEAIRGKR